MLPRSNRRRAPLNKVAAPLASIIVQSQSTPPGATSSSSSPLRLCCSRARWRASFVSRRCAMLCSSKMRSSTYWCPTSGSKCGRRRDLHAACLLTPHLAMPTQSITTKSMMTSRTGAGQGVNTSPGERLSVADSAHETDTAIAVRKSSRTVPVTSSSATWASDASARAATSRTSGSEASSRIRCSSGRSSGRKCCTSATDGNNLHMFSHITVACLCVLVALLFRPRVITGIITANAGASTSWTKTTSAISRTHFATSFVARAHPMTVS
mmetsp:Transcript_53728/g.128010  ORF Transcript_53728/g.128010 Transcript_53728/m.128010 type:complete len:268 (+) Transcript_53728:1972-2775(+)